MPKTTKPKCEPTKGRCVKCDHNKLAQINCACTGCHKPKKKVREWIAWAAIEINNELLDVRLAKEFFGPMAHIRGHKIIKVKITAVGGRRKGR